MLGSSDFEPFLHRHDGLPKSGFRLHVTNGIRKLTPKISNL